MVRLRVLPLGLLLFLGSDAHSQPSGTPPPGATPATVARTVADPEAATKPLAYRSPFSEYRADKAEELGSWREVNDRVGAIGGWRVYAREAQAPQPAPTAVESQKPAPGK
jgi:hypothetical protein